MSLLLNIALIQKDKGKDSLLRLVGIDPYTAERLLGSLYDSTGIGRVAVVT